MRIKAILLIFTSISVLSCQHSKPTINLPIVEKTAPRKVDEPISMRLAEKNVRKVYNASETVLTDIIHTKLEVNFNWEKAQMNGTATITAKPYFYTTDSLILDAKGMDIHSVELDKKTLMFSYDSSYLRINLGRIYTKDEKYTVVIQYTSKPNERLLGGSSAITSDKGLYFINPTGSDPSKMPQIWTQGETEASSVWFPTIDSPNTKTTQETYITVAEKYVTLSNGKLISTRKNNNGTRTDYWKQDLPHAPYLFMLAVGEFKIVKDYYTRKDGSKMEVNYYVEPAYEANAKAIFGETPAMISYFSNLLGVEYPWDKYHQIVVREYVSGAMENTGAVIFGDYVYKNDRELLDENDQSTIAHELFHHWFGDLVTCESWSNLPLNESFANYSQYLWDEFRNGKDEADYQASIEADGYYQSAQSSGYHNLIWFDYENREQMFDGHSYNKGGRILHMLRSYIGDEAFFKALNLYLTANKFKPAEFNQLRLAFEEVCGEDLNWFFNQWFLAAGHPVLDVKQTQTNNTVSLSIQQNQNLELSPLFRLPLEIAIYDDLGEHIHKISIDSLKQTFSFPFSGTLKNCEFDYQYQLLAKVREDKPAQHYQFQYYHSKRYTARKNALIYGTKDKSAVAQQLIIDAINDSFWHIRSLAIEKAGKLTNENAGKALIKIKELALNDPNSSVRASALTYVANNSEANEPLFIQSLEKDKSYKVLGTSMRALAEINPELAVSKVKQWENETSSKTLVIVAQVYAQNGDKNCYTFFNKVLKSNFLQGYDQLIVLNSMTYYLTRQTFVELETAFEMYTYLQVNGTAITKQFIGQNCTYISSFIDDKIEKLTEKLTTQEQNKDALYADQTRQEIKKYTALKEKYSGLTKK
jgi:aminopeptidase N